MKFNTVKGILMEFDDGYKLAYINDGKKVQHIPYKHVLKEENISEENIGKDILYVKEIK